MQDDLTTPFSYVFPNGDRMDGRCAKIGSAIGVVRFCSDHFVVGMPISVGGEKFVIENVEPRKESVLLSLRANLES